MQHAHPNDRGYRRPVLDGLIAIGMLVVATAGCSSEAVDVTQTTQALQQQGQCVDLPAVADAMLSNPPMDHNFGGMPIMRAGGKDESLVRFDLGSIPASSVVDSATLKLYVSGTDSGAPNTVNVHRALAPWSEGSVTFQSFAQHFDPAVVGSILATSSNVLKSVDATAIARRWLSGAEPNLGFLLERATNAKTIFVTREGGTAGQKPTLRVCYRVVVDECTPGPCQNGGTCENRDTGYVCQCNAGYSGRNCETLVDNCASSPCQNGATCTNSPNSYSCSCTPGFAGPNCAINIDDCSPSPCQHGGVCQDGVDSHTCSCPVGYTGANCETLVDNCQAAPCQNGATCTSSPSGYACSCAPGFGGTNCEINIDDCSANPCQNAGTCIDGINSHTCSCPPDWGGAACEVNLSTCSQNPCLNGGACTNGFGNYTCSCAPGFSGTNCQVDINDCASNPCQNGGVCNDRVNGFTCTCAAGFTGTTCEIAPPTCGGDGERACCNGCGELSTVGTACDAGTIVVGTQTSRACGGPASCAGFTTADTCAAPRPCGGVGQRACCFAEQGTSSACNTGLIEVAGCTAGDPSCLCGNGLYSSGRCAAPQCGGPGQRGCCFGAERGALGLSGPCGAGLLELGTCTGSDCQCLSPAGSSSLGRCTAPQCGGAGQRGCCFGAERGALGLSGPCGAGLLELGTCTGTDCQCLSPAGVSSLGRCTPPQCGGDGQRGCCIGAERSVLGISGPCQPGRVEVGPCTGSDCQCTSPLGAASSGRCVAPTSCGGEGQRACCVAERTDNAACDAGLVQSGTCTGQLGASQCVCSSGATSVGVCVRP